MYLEKINSPEDLKKLGIDKLDTLAAEIRQFLVDSVSHTGGHLASNLGVVDLTIAMHYAFCTMLSAVLATNLCGMWVIRHILTKYLRAGAMNLQLCASLTV